MEVRDNICARLPGGALLAPMLGITDIPFREICAAYGATLTYTEMVSARGILDNSPYSYRNAVFDPDRHPVAIQLVAASPEDAVYAITQLLPMRPVAFDINAGCPNDRICAVGAGAGLLDDLPRFAEVIRAAVRVSPVPVSVKIRAGGNRRDVSVVHLARAAEAEGAAWITVHGRTPGMPYDHPVMTDRIAAAKAAVSIPVVANGDIFSAHDARRMMRETGCDSVMIARGSLGSPWIFRALASGADTSGPDELPPFEEVRSLVAGHMRSIMREYGPVYGLPRMRKHALWYARHYDGMEDLRRSLFASDDFRAMLRQIDLHFEEDRLALDIHDPVRIERESRFRRRVLYWTSSIQAVSR